MLTLDGCFDLDALRCRARLAAARLAGGAGAAGMDSAPLPARAADERGLAGLLAGSEGVASTLVSNIPPCERYAFKLTCRHFRAALVTHSASTLTRTSLRAIVDGGPSYARWAASRGGLPWPLAGIHVALELCLDKDRWAADAQTLRRRPAGIEASLTLEPRRADCTRLLQRTQWLGSAPRGTLSLMTVHEQLTSAAARHGNLALLRWAASEHCRLSAATAIAAASGGQVAVLRWLLAQGCLMDHRCVRAAALHGQRDAFEWAMTAGLCAASQLSSQSALAADAVAGGLPAVVERVLPGAGLPEAAQRSLTHLAASRGHVAVLELLRAQQPPVAWDGSCWLGACANSQLYALDALEEGGCPLTLADGDRPLLRAPWSLYDSAASGRDDPDTAFAFIEHTPWMQPGAVVSAWDAEPSHEHSDPLQRIGVEQYSRPRVAIRTAAQDAAAVAVLEKLRVCDRFELPASRGEASSHTCELAAATGSVQVLQWLHAHGWRIGPRTSLFAAQRGSIPMLSFLHSVGCPFDELTFRVACGGQDCIRPTPVAQWLAEHGCPSVDVRREYIEARMLDDAKAEELSDAMPHLIAAEMARRGRPLTWRTADTLEKMLDHEYGSGGARSDGGLRVLQTELVTAMDAALEKWDAIMRCLLEVGQRDGLDLSEDLDELHHALGMQQPWDGRRLRNVGSDYVSAVSREAKCVLGRWRAAQVGHELDPIRQRCYRNRFA